jgi:hypothetical protein
MVGEGKGVWYMICTYTRMHVCWHGEFTLVGRKNPGALALGYSSFQYPREQGGLPCSQTFNCMIDDELHNLNSRTQKEKRKAFFVHERTCLSTSAEIQKRRPQIGPTRSLTLHTR